MFYSHSKSYALVEYFGHPISGRLLQYGFNFRIHNSLSYRLFLMSIEISRSLFHNDTIYIFLKNLSLHSSSVIVCSYHIFILSIYTFLRNILNMCRCLFFYVCAFILKVFHITKMRE